MHGLQRLRRVQREVHRYGEANQIKFDASKESFHYLHAIHGFSFEESATFRILGCEFDPQLLMHEAVQRLATEAGWRLRAIMRNQKYFTIKEFVRLYKALVLSYLESYTPAIFHAAPSVLHKIDRVKSKLLERIHVSPSQAFAKYNLAPLATWREIAMLGVLYKVARDTAPTELKRLFPNGPQRLPNPYPVRETGFRLTRASHKKQLQTLCTPFSTERLRRSIFGMVELFNALPEWVVEVPNVKLFQKVLQKGVLRHSASYPETWQNLLRDGWKQLTCLRFDSTFAKSDLQKTYDDWEPDDYEEVNSDSE